MIKLLEKFPVGFKPTKQQVYLLEEIDKAFESGCKVVVVNAPTGSGKSMISKSVGNVSNTASDEFRDLVYSYAAYKQVAGGFENAEKIESMDRFGAFALTITKTLQDQYANLFKDTRVLKGKSNYICKVDDRFTVDCAPCLTVKSLKESCQCKNICPYYNARNDALAAQFSTLNYSMFFGLPEHLRHRQFLICDEASELEDVIVKQFSCAISFDYLKKNGIKPIAFPERYDKIPAWLSYLSTAVRDKVEEKTNEIRNIRTKTAKILSDKRSELNVMQGLHGSIQELISNWSQTEFVYETIKNTLTFVPVYVDKLATNLFKYADKIILLSATIIDPKNFCKSLGIENFKYIEVDSEFDPVNAPIHVQTKVKLNYKNLATQLPTICKQVAEICNHHRQDKGIIHTHTMAITKVLQTKLNSPRMLYREQGVKNEDILEQHTQATTPTVLISPSMSFGVDLKDDLARFQVIVKAPFLPLTDKRVKKLADKDYNWYINKMLCSLIQSCGRGVRSGDDHCVTYILDGIIVDKILENKHKLPKYFLKRFI